MLVSLLFAIDEKNGIGKGGVLPWHLPADLKRFKQLTMGHYAIMGRRTFESIGRPLPGRKLIVVSRNPNYVLPPYIPVKSSLEAALAEAKAKGETEAFIIGGAQLFMEAMPIADRFYLTKIAHTFDADVFLPPLKMEEWNVLEEQHSQPDDKNKYSYSFLTLERKRPS